MKFKFNVLTGVFDRVSGEGNYIQKFNLVTGKFNLVDDVDNYQQIINPLTGKFQLWAEGGKKYEKEVTGNGYIDLTDAVVNKLLELKAYGGCTQASTPTPTTPVDIVCNNGTLKVKDKELPVGYVRLESIELDAGPYYNTNEKLYGSDVVSMRISQNGSNGRNVFGAYTSTSSDVNFSFYAYPTATGQAYLRYGGSLYRPVVGTGTRSITFGSGGTTGFATNSTIPEQTFETEDVVYIGALPDSSSSRFDGTFYGNIEVSNNGTTRLKWIPCKRKSDGVIGYYEVVNGNFLEPSGSGTPVAGAEDYSNIEVYVDGTKETIQAKGKNLFDVNNPYKSGYAITQNGKEIVVSTFSIYSLKAEPLTTYTYSCNYTESVTTRIHSYDKNGNWIQQDTYGNANATKTFTTTSNTAEIRISINNTAALSAQLELGSTATEYEPYFNSGTATCEDLLGVGDYKDEQEILSGNVITKVGVAVLDGTENWSQATTSQGVYRYRFEPTYEPKIDGGRGPCVSTHFVDIGGVTTQDVGGAFASTTYLYFIPNQDVNTVAKWTTFLANQLSAGTPVIVVYPLATPTTLSVAGQHLSIPAGNSRIEIVEGSILDLPLYAKYLSTTE